MATFVVCTRCGKTQEIAEFDQLPENWQRSHADLVCPHCTTTDVLDGAATSDVLDEEVIYPSSDTATEDTFDEGYCEVCNGPCQGH